MSSNYCVQLTQNLAVISIVTLNPVNFTSLQFSLSQNSLVIFLFSKYPFNFGYAGIFCINADEFGFAQVGESFDIDLSNYQGYYMLILIYTPGINFENYTQCDTVDSLTMTFQNTTISPIQSETVINNFDGRGIRGFCPCYDGISHYLGELCNNSNNVSIISLNELNNQLVIITCQGFVYENDTTVGFITPGNCPNFGSTVTAEITFIGNQEVIDFLNNNNISYNILSSSSCQPSFKLHPCVLPCKSYYQIAKLLSPPTSHSLISSKLWNEIVQDLYLTYTVFKYINLLAQFPYPHYIYSTILDLYNPQPYPFTPLLHAQKGTPLTAKDFNKLIDAILELANEGTIQLQACLNKVQHDEVVRASQFANVVYNVNQLLTFNYNQYFLLSCSGEEFNNLLNSINTFLTVLINFLNVGVTIPSNVYIKNLLVYTNNYGFNIYGQIDKLIVVNNGGPITINSNAYINTLFIENNNGIIEIFNNATVENLICKQNSGIVYISSGAIVINNQCS